MLPQFAHPFALLLILALPPLLWWWLRLGRGAVSYPQTSELLRLPRGRGGWARYGGAGLRAAALQLLILALAGPRWPDPGTRIPTEGIAINILVDVSGSMAERDFTWKNADTGQDENISRLEAVKKVFRLFVEGGEGLPGRTNDLIGLVTFATRPESACPLTLSHSVLLKLLDEEQPRAGAIEGRTNIGDAIAWGLYRLKSAGGRRKVMVLLTDGEHNVPRPALKPRQAAQLPGNLGVPVYIIDAGVDSKSSLENDSAVDRLNAKKQMEEVAKVTGGRYFSAHDTASLLEVCGQIDQMERQQIESFQYRRYYEGFAWIGLGGLVLLLMVSALEATLWRKLP